MLDLWLFFLLPIRLAKWIWLHRPYIWKDDIYGWCWEYDPTVCSVIRSPTFRRLDGILQAGTPALLGFLPKEVTRKSHCLGTMRLVRHCGGSSQEQLAALLHDVTHCAFSHVADLLFQD